MIMDETNIDKRLSNYQNRQHQMQTELHFSGIVMSPSKQNQQVAWSSTLFMNQSFEQYGLSPEKEGSRRLTQNKLRHKKLKQKLNMLSQQILDQGLFKDQKDMTSPNKSRLLKLAIELDKVIRTQAIDYQQVESFLRQIQKIVEHKRQHDILILRGARVMTTLIALIKKFPSLHRNEAAQSMVSMELSLRLLRIMLSLGASRELLLISNQLTPISSLLSCSLMRQDKKLAISCLYLLNLILLSPNRIQLHEIINVNLQYILCSSLLKRLKTFLELCLAEDDPSSSEFILLGFKFYYCVITRSCQKELERPIYGTPVMDNLSRAVNAYFESGIQLLVSSLIDLLYERQIDSDQKYLSYEEDIPNFKINILLYIFKSLNVIFHVNIHFAQKILETNTMFMKALHFIFNYVRQNFKQGNEIKKLCNQIIIFIGNFTYQSHSNQNIVRQYGILSGLCNLPLQYMMDHLKHLFIPTLCSVIHQNQKNFKDAFQENSVANILKYIEKQINRTNDRKIEEDPCLEFQIQNKNAHCKTLSRKTSVSSMNSSYSTYSKTSIADSISIYNGVMKWESREMRLQYKFKQENWEEMISELRKIDD